jgi:sulfatase maturation enzyme AslB (radical SAM superfamily)
MSWSVLRRALDLILASDHPTPRLTFYGGEPLLELPLIMRAIEYLEAGCSAGCRVDVSVFTNGTLMDRGTRRFLAGHDVSIQISFDGVEVAQDQRAPGTFSRIDRTLSRLREEYPGFFRDRCSVAITASSGNVAHVADSFAYLLDRGVPEIAISPLMTHDQGWQRITMEVLSGQIEEIYRLSRERYSCTGEIPFDAFRGPDQGGRHAAHAPALCGATTPSSLAVNVDGRVYGCVLVTESYQRVPDGLLGDCLPNMRFGDIRERSFARRLETQTATADTTPIFFFREKKRSSYRTCRGCRFANQCSICPVSIGHIPGNTDPYRVPDIQCAFNLAILTAREQFFKATGQ